LLDTKPAEIRSFLHGNLSPARTQELQNNLLAIGIPLWFLICTQCGSRVIFAGCLQIMSAHLQLMWVENTDVFKSCGLCLQVVTD